MKKVIMIIGGNASGKTTTAKLIHQNCNGISKAKEIRKLEFINENNEDDFTFVTLYDRTAHVGKVEDNQCTGTDSLNTKNKIEFSYLYLVMLSDVRIIVLDSIMSTSTWSEMIHQVNHKYDVKTILVLLNYKDIEANYVRLKQRRAHKTGEPVESIILNDTTQSNVLSKLKGFKNMFEKIKNNFNVSIEIDADLPAEEIHQLIKQAAGL